MQHETLDQDDSQLDALEPGTKLLHGQYVVDRYLVRGGFGITYLAKDSLDRQVVIKECFPGAICCRIDGKVQATARSQDRQYSSILRHFLREARRLARLSHPNIVGVHQVFEENDTAYMALDYVNGVDLLSILEDEPDKLTPQVIRSTLETALAAIRYIHGQGILHRDISPDNFLLGPTNELTLIDFGAAREHAGKENRALSALLAVKDGYSPHEFYLTDVTQYPSSDLYSLGATFYHLITGEAPPNSQERLAAIAADSPDPYHPLVHGTTGYDHSFLAAIDKALAVLPKDRIQSAEDWLKELGKQCRAPITDNSVHLSAELRRAIARLVEETNRMLKPGKPEVRIGVEQADNTPKFQPLICEPERQKTGQPVDIFGNPIQDVDAWLRDQDHMTQTRMRVGSPEQTQFPEMKTNPAEVSVNGSQSTFSRLLMGRMSPLRLSRQQAAQN